MNFIGDIFYSISSFMGFSSTSSDASTMQVVPFEPQEVFLLPTDKDSHDTITREVMEDAISLIEREATEVKIEGTVREENGASKTEKEASSSSTPSVVVPSVLASESSSELPVFSKTDETKKRLSRKRRFIDTFPGACSSESKCLREKALESASSRVPRLTIEDLEGKINRAPSEEGALFRAMAASDVQCDYRIQVKKGGEPLLQSIANALNLRALKHSEDKYLNNGCLWDSKRVAQAMTQKLSEMYLVYSACRDISKRNAILKSLSDYLFCKNTVKSCFTTAHSFLSGTFMAMETGDHSCRRDDYTLGDKYIVLALASFVFDIELQVESKGLTTFLSEDGPYYFSPNDMEEELDIFSSCRYVPEDKEDAVSVKRHERYCILAHNFHKKSQDTHFDNWINEADFTCISRSLVRLHDANDPNYQLFYDALYSKIDVMMACLESEAEERRENSFSIVANNKRRAEKIKENDKLFQRIMKGSTNSRIRGNRNAQKVMHQGAQEKTLPKDSQDHTWFYTVQ